MTNKYQKKPKIGTLGMALIKALKKDKTNSFNWLKSQLNKVFKKDRQRQFSKTQFRKRNRNEKNQYVIFN